MLSRRQVDVQRHNLTSMCRIAVKSLLDYACLNMHVDEDCEEFVNFCAVFEQLVSHRLRPYQKRVWHRGEGTPRFFWDVLLDNLNMTHGCIFHTCIPNIERIENIKSPKAKLRAFLRVALMEKRLSEYLYWVNDNRNLMRRSYLEGALFASEEGAMLCGDLIGLNAIDFNFCLKGNENELLGPLEINYAPFVRHIQSSASQTVDAAEMLRLSGKNVDNDNSSEISLESSDAVKLQNLEKDYRSIKEQKEYLEEMLRLRERQLTESKMKVEMLEVKHERMEEEWVRERKTLDACVLELQGAISNIRSENNYLRQQVVNLQFFKSRFDLKEVPLMDMAEGCEERVYASPSAGQRGKASSTGSMTEVKSYLSDQRSIQSSTSDQIRLKEDSHSMIPLTGSLADVNVAMLKDQPNVTNQGKDLKQGDIASQAKDGKNAEAFVAVSGITESFVMAEVVAEDGSPAEGDANTTEMAAESDVVATGVTVPSEEKDSEDDVSGSKKVEEQERQDNADPQMSSIEPLGACDDAAFIDVGRIKLPDVMTTSDGSYISLGAEAKDEEVLTSDPEILDRINNSSDGSDAAWDMVSDSEQTH